MYKVSSIYIYRYCNYIYIVESGYSYAKSRILTGWYVSQLSHLYLGSPLYRKNNINNNKESTCVPRKIVLSPKIEVVSQPKRYHTLLHTIRWFPKNRASPQFHPFCEKNPPFSIINPSSYWDQGQGTRNSRRPEEYLRPAVRWPNGTGKSSIRPSWKGRYYLVGG